MNTYFIHDDNGKLVGWIETTDESNARMIADTLHGKNTKVSQQPRAEWYARRETAPEQQDFAFAA